MLAKVSLLPVCNLSIHVNQTGGSARRQGAHSHAFALPHILLSIKTLLAESNTARIAIQGKIVMLNPSSSRLAMVMVFKGLKLRDASGGGGTSDPDAQRALTE